MSKKTKPKTSFFKSFFKKLPWVLGFAIVFMILSLKVVERFPQPLKEGVEGYFQSASGHSVSITELEEITFFPEILIQMREIVFSDNVNIAQTNMTIESAKAHIPFLNMFTGGRRIYDFEVRNLNAKADVITPQEIMIEFLDIASKPEDEEVGVLVISGYYANQPLLMNVMLDRKKTIFGRTVYKVPQNTKIELIIADVYLKTDFVNEPTGIWFRNGLLTRNAVESPIKDSALIKGQVSQDDNIISCLLVSDYKNIDEICETYINEENE